LRKVHGPKRDTNGWINRTNKKLQDQYRNADRVIAIKVRQLEWASHEVKMDDERMVKRAFLGTQEEEGNQEDRS
jgi:hypothetical protein